MEIMTLNLAGIYWDDHARSGQNELTVYANLAGRNSRVTLKFEDLSQPTDVQGMFDTFGLNQPIKLVTVPITSKKMTEDTSNKEQSVSKPALPSPESKITQPVQAVSDSKPVPGEHLQPTNTTSFDPQEVGDKVASRLKTERKDQTTALAPAPVESVSYNQPKMFNPTDFETDKANELKKKKTTVNYDDNGHQINVEESDSGDDGSQDRFPY